MKYLIAQLYFILFTATIFAQTSQVYKTKDGYHTLTLLNDSAFVYEYFFGFHHSHTEGFYILKQKDIILENQYSDFETIDFKVNKTTTETSIDSITFIIKTNFQDTSLIDVVCILDTLYVRGALGQAFKVSKHYRNLQIIVKLKDPDRLNFYPLRDTLMSNKYSLNDDIKSLEIYWPIDINTFYAEMIKNEILLQRGKKIYWPSKSIKLEKIN